MTISAAMVSAAVLDGGLSDQAGASDEELALLLLPHRPPPLWGKCPTCDYRTRRPGLPCWRCRRAATFAHASRHAYVGVGNGNHGYELPASPTTALPGSPEKVAVLEERARLGLALWHPDDAR